MTADQTKDWDPGTYARFRGLRLRPALDLLAQVPALPSGDVVDLGCGNGMAATDLRMRFAPRRQRRLIGVDNSPAMLAEAAKLDLYDRLDEADVALWAPHEPPALIFSNALLHWLPEHEVLLPRLARALAPGGTLAIQMPRQFLAPSHVLLRETAAQLLPGRFEYSGWTPPVADAPDYDRLLRPLGEVTVWETEYCQRMARVAEGHPVRHFTQSTAMRPMLAQLDGSEIPRFVAAYDAALAEPYPLEPDGSALMPFRRLFVILTRPA